MKLALLAAGFATRMYPLTKNNPKPLLEFHGQTLLTRLLLQALETGVIEEAAVVVNAKFQAKFEDWAYGQDFPVKVITNKSKNEKESHGALADLNLLINQGFQSSIKSPWMVLAGDNLMDFSLSKAVEKHSENVKQPLFLVRKIKGFIPPNQYSEVRLDSLGFVKQIREKPKNPSSPYSAIGVYLLPCELPKLLAKYLQQGGIADQPGHFMAWLSLERKCRFWKIPDGLWWDVGCLDSYKQAKKARLNNLNFSL